MSINAFTGVAESRDLKKERGMFFPSTKNVKWCRNKTRYRIQCNVLLTKFAWLLILQCNKLYYCLVLFMFWYYTTLWKFKKKCNFSKGKGAGNPLLWSTYTLNYEVAQYSLVFFFYFSALVIDGYKVIFHKKNM